MRHVFFSFHFDNDFWRTQQVRNIGALEGQALCTANRWEEVKRGGAPAIQRWVADNMNGKSCVVVLVGAQTALRPWVKYEIQKGWSDRKGVVAIRVHRLLDVHSNPSMAGPNPLAEVPWTSGKTLAQIAQIKDPAGADSKAVYATIANNIEGWIEEAISIRQNA